MDVKHSSVDAPWIVSVGPLVAIRPCCRRRGAVEEWRVCGDEARQDGIGMQSVVMPTMSGDVESKKQENNE